MSFLSKIGKWAAKVLLPLGGWGLFLAAFADSSFIPLPEGVDLWLITLSILQPHRMPLYVLLATVGSVLGCAVLYATVRWGEKKFLEGKKNSKLPRVQRWVEEYEFRALVLGAMLPPPMPLKLFVIASGLARGHFLKVMLAITIGRVIRYGGEGYLAVRYGKKAWEVLLRMGPYVLVSVLIVVGLYFLFRQGKSEQQEDATNAI